MTECIMNRSPITTLWLRRFTTTLLLGLGTAGVAQGANDSLTVNITGTITEAACKVNNNQAIAVEFGTVRIDQLEKATASVPVTITCDSAPQGTVQITARGDAASFDANALKTDVTGLGIQLSKGKVQVTPGTFYDVSSDFGLTSKTGTFSLTASLVSDGKTNLAGGEFNASATLVLQVS